MKKHLLVKTALSGLFATLCTVGIVSFPGSQKQDYDYSEKDDLDPALLNSPELEEYIIAGAEYREASNTFATELGKIDFSKLKFEEDLNGDRIIRIPISVSIEKKAMNFETKKNALFVKHPQFASMSPAIQYDYFRACIKSSTNVNRKLLEMGININRPLTKGGTSEEFANMEDLTDYLSAQMSSSDYREIVIIVYQDGRIATYQDDANTSSSFHISIPYTVEDNPKYYYPQALDANGNLIEKNRIRYIAHTQLSGHTPSSGDLNYSKDYPGLQQGIYHDGTIKMFTK